MKTPFRIYNEAFRLGFDLCGVARCRELAEQKERFSAWLGGGCDGGLDYLKRNFDKRFDPAALVPGARSIIVCAVSYNRPPSRGEISSRIATYALNRDYHLTIREKLTALLDTVRTAYPGTQGRVFVDTAPLLEKSWAAEAGLGWIGRNSLLNNPRFGSFLLLGTVVTDAELPADVPYTEDNCKNCRACVRACPVNAIRDDRTIDASCCISRKTIEKEPESEGDLHGWLFGCDICQRACPHNRHASLPGHPEFTPDDKLENLTREQLLGMNRGEFKRLFGETPLSRCGLERLKNRLRDPEPDEK